MPITEILSSLHARRKNEYGVAGNLAYEKDGGKEAQVKKKTTKIAGKRSSGTPTNTLIELYSLAQSALLREQDRIWSRFTVYLTLNSAVATPLVLSVKDMVSNPSQHYFSIEMAVAGCALALVGGLLSLCWLRTTQSGQGWQDHCIEYLCELEKELAEAKFWKRVKDYATFDKKHIRIMRLAEKVNYCFLVVWSLVLILCIGRLLYAICQIDEITLMKETSKMLRTFIQCAAFLEAVISAVLLIKGGISLSVKDMAELSQTKWDYSLAILKNLVQQKAYTIVGFSLLMLSVAFQMLHWLLPFGIDDLGVNRTGVIIAFVAAVAMWFVANRLSCYLGQKWYTQVENILSEAKGVMP